MVEKAINTKVEANLQPPSKTKEINSRCLRGYRPSVKKDKDDANWKHRDEAPKNKTKSHNSSSINQPQIQASKKDRHQKNQQGDYPATRVNTSEIAKKDRDKTKDLNHIKYYTSKNGKVQKVDPSQKSRGF